MPDLDAVLAAKPGDGQALSLRGIVWSAMHDYSRALDDLNQAIAKQETIENLVARAGVYEAKNDVKNATADFRRATQLAAKNVFDLLAQANAKQKIQQLSKQLPCGSGRADGSACL
jgi:tetratricopeptide (TPR) repeat protein